MLRAAVLLAALAATACGGSTLPPSAPSPLLGGPLPSFGRKTLSGAAPANLDRELVVVKFFAKFCAPCQKTLPAAQALHERRSDVTVVGVSEDETEADAREQVARYGLTFTVVHDRGNAIAGRFRITEMPHTFVADRARNVVWVGGPDQDEDDLERAIDALSR